MKYKPGDKVRVRADLNPNDDYGGLPPVMSMCMERGNIVTIKDGEVRDGLKAYHIEGDMCGFLWTEEMFEKIADKEKAGAAMKYKVGDKVKIRKDLEYDKRYSDVRFDKDMEKYRGGQATITRVHEKFQTYEIDLDQGRFMWGDDMFLKLADMAKNDPVSHPSHYTDGKIEVIDFIQDKHLDFARGNVVKYISRAGKKGGSKEKELEDLKKARQYCEFAIHDLEGRV